MNNKIDVLKELASKFNQSKVKWNVGASCMLYLRGITSAFNDIDIIIDEKDVELVKEILKDFIPNQVLPNEKYKTKVFLEYVIHGVDIDIMAGFTILSNNKDYYFPIKDKSSYDTIKIDEVEIVLGSVEEWYTYYKLMDRKDKVELLSSYGKEKV